jgi:hypothetical protein
MHYNQIQRFAFWLLELGSIEQAAADPNETEVRDYVSGKYT